jgi:hypothetical protein
LSGGVRLGSEKHGELIVHRRSFKDHVAVNFETALPMLFSVRTTIFDAHREGAPALMAAMGVVNGRFSKKTMFLASEGMTRSWQLRADHRSPRYTTRLTDLPVVKLDRFRDTAFMVILSDKIINGVIIASRNDRIKNGF